MHLYEFTSSRDEVNSILVAADYLEDLHKQGKLKSNMNTDQFVKYVNNYLYQNNSNLVLTKKDILKMVSSPKNPFKMSIKNIQGDEVIFKGNQEKPPPEPQTAEKSKDTVEKMAKKTIGK